MKLIVVLILLHTAGVLKAQVKISGRVTDNKNRPVAGASIQLKNTYDGATTDAMGNYSFDTDETGMQVLEVSSAGYVAVSQNIQVDKVPLVINIMLKEQITELKAVVITAGSFEASDKNKGAVLTSLDIVTTPSANADVTGAFKTLPGTQQVGESEGLFVRGGAATESKIYIDGQLVNNFFYSSTPGIATRGFIWPGIVVGINTGKYRFTGKVAGRFGYLGSRHRWRRTATC
jgi:vitamin B12 transporter